MKKWHLYLLLLIALPLVRCGEGKNDQPEDEELYEFQGFSMKPYDIPVMIMLPDETANIGASTKPEVIHEEGGFQWQLSVGPNFQMIIDDWGSYTTQVAEEKKKLATFPFYNIKYIIDEPDLIMYEKVLKVDGKKGVSNRIGVEHKTYHVYGQKVINKINYVFQSRPEGYERVIIDLMVKSIRSVKPLK
jgi:hypothetical protein